MIQRFSGALFLFMFFGPGYSQGFQNLKLGVRYSNLSTVGNLQARLFKVALEGNILPPAIRVSISCYEYSSKSPLTITIIHGKTVHNIALTRVQTHQGKKYEYWYASDTLCDDDFQINEPVFLSIISYQSSMFSLMVKSVENFNIGHEPLHTLSSPLESQYFLYTFPDDVEKVDVRFTSESSICASVIARRANCPIFDGSGLFEKSDVYFRQTFTKFGAFSVTKLDVGSRFHIAITVNPNDSACEKIIQNSNNSSRIKTTLIHISPSTDNCFLLAVPLLVYLISVTVVLILTYLKYRWLDSYENNEPNIFGGTETEGYTITKKIELFEKPNNIVSHKEYEKQKLVKDSKYFNFLFFQIFGSILPALTTLFQNRQQASNRMDLDICYLNYRCAPWWSLLQFPQQIDKCQQFSSDWNSKLDGGI